MTPVVLSPDEAIPVSVDLSISALPHIVHLLVPLAGVVVGAAIDFAQFAFEESHHFVLVQHLVTVQVCQGCVRVLTESGK